MDNNKCEITNVKEILILERRVDMRWDKQNAWYKCKKLSNIIVFFFFKRKPIAWEVLGCSLLER